MDTERITIKLDEELGQDLSAVVQVEDTLWLGVDEGTSVDRVSAADESTYDNQLRFELGEILDLRGDKEIDIEGLDYSGGYLWLVGSHSLKRQNPDPEDSEKANWKALRKLEREVNRYLLARVPLVRESGELVVDRDGKKSRAARLKHGDKGNALSIGLESDKHLGPFTAIPSKDNGLDIEGLAVSCNTVFVGLRGPVLRGWAVIMRMELEGEKNGRLQFNKIGKSDVIFVKHFLDLDGYGVRDMIVDGEDLIILAGPSMDLLGPVVTYRWKGAVAARKQKLIWTKDLEKVVRLPLEASDGKAEGMTRFNRAGKPPGLLVVYDAPTGT
ncbi:MAG: DUF3616 domain-containing protein, partial [bacterium]|nr:DUF3616 domain-containing protein [bacterium]